MGALESRPSTHSVCCFHGARSIFEGLRSRAISSGEGYRAPESLVSAFRETLSRVSDTEFRFILTHLSDLLTSVTTPEDGRLHGAGPERDPPEFPFRLRDGILQVGRQRVGSSQHEAASEPWPLALDGLASFDFSDPLRLRYPELEPALDGDFVEAALERLASAAASDPELLAGASRFVFLPAQERAVFAASSLPASLLEDARAGRAWGALSGILLGGHLSQEKRDALATDALSFGLSHLAPALSFPSRPGSLSARWLHATIASYLSDHSGDPGNSRVTSLLEAADAYDRHAAPYRGIVFCHPRFGPTHPLWENAARHVLGPSGDTLYYRASPTLTRQQVRLDLARRLLHEHARAGQASEGADARQPSSGDGEGSWNVVVLNVLYRFLSGWHPDGAVLSASGCPPPSRLPFPDPGLGDGVFPWRSKRLERVPQPLDIPSSLMDGLIDLLEHGACLGTMYLMHTPVAVGWHTALRSPRARIA